MKKILLVATAFAVILCFAACNKDKKQIYEPNTTVINVGDGETVIFEIVTEENGEVATDEEGETKYIPYIPPVTDKEGCLVTDSLGSTIPSRPAETGKPSSGTSTPNIDSDIGELDEPTNANGETAKPEFTTIVSDGLPTTKPAATTNPTATTKPSATSKPESTTTPSTNTTTKPSAPSTTKPTVTEAVTTPIDGSISSAKAQKLVGIMEGVENPFDENLSDADFYAAEKSIDTYITNVETAVNAIKADASLYQFVGKQQLSLWLDNMYEARERYQIFMTMVRQEEGKKEKNPLYYKAYTDFQNSYRSSLEAYYFILFAAQEKI